MEFSVSMFPFRVIFLQWLYNPLANLDLFLLPSPQIPSTSTSPSDFYFYFHTSISCHHLEIYFLKLFLCSSYYSNILIDANLTLLIHFGNQFSPSFLHDPTFYCWGNLGKKKLLEVSTEPIMTYTKQSFVNIEYDMCLQVNHTT